MGQEPRHLLAALLRLSQGCNDSHGGMTPLQVLSVPGGLLDWGLVSAGCYLEATFLATWASRLTAHTQQFASSESAGGRLGEGCGHCPGHGLLAEANPGPPHSGEGVHQLMSHLHVCALLPMLFFWVALIFFIIFFNGLGYLYFHIPTYTHTFPTVSRVDQIIYPSPKWSKVI